MTLTGDTKGADLWAAYRGLNPILLSGKLSDEADILCAIEAVKEKREWHL